MSPSRINVIVWNEFQHERENDAVRAIYPDGIHATIAAALQSTPALNPGGGPLIDLGVHRLDLALWLMGYPQPTWVMGSSYDSIGRVAAARSGRAFDVDDLAAAFIRFDNGASLLLEASRAANIREAELMEARLLGSRAGLLPHNLGEGHDFDAHLFCEQDGAQYDLRLHPTGAIGLSAMHDYAQAILNHTPHPAPGEEGLLVMQILDAIYESAHLGEPVKIAP